MMLLISNDTINNLHLITINTFIIDISKCLNSLHSHTNFYNIKHKINKNLYAI